MSTRVANAIDPYAEWLKVRTPRRPPNPYEMLGLDPGACTAEEIEQAAILQRSALQRHRGGPHVDLWSSVRIELDRAIDILLDPRQRLELDARLERDGGVFFDGSRRPRTTGTPDAACVHCDTINPPHAKFCSSCGRPQQRRCPSCERECPLSVRFCSACGHDLASHDDVRFQDFIAQIDAAETLRRQCRFDEAHRQVGAVADRVQAETDARFQSLAERCDAIEQAIAEDRASWSRKVQAVMSRAGELMQRCAYPDAALVLDEIPASLRSDESAQLLNEARRKATESSALAAEIRHALETRKTAELLPSVLRLLELKPGQPKLIELRDQLHAALLDAARKRLAAHRFDNALDLLRKIPVSMHDESASRLIEAATEFSCLARCVREAPVADDSLVRLLERWRRIMPDNKEAAALLQKAQRQSSEPVSDPRFHAAAWTPSPKSTPLGPEVVWLAAPHRCFDDATIDVKRLHDPPGRMFVAMGLALQAIGRGPMTMNFAPQPKSRLFRNLPKLRTPNRIAAWGVDLGGSSLKAVKLSHDLKAETVTLEAAEFIPFEQSLGSPDAAPRREQIMASAFNELNARHSIGPDEAIAVNLTGSRVLSRFFMIPPLPAKKMNDAILFELKRLLPLALDELEFGFVIAPLSSDDEDTMSASRRVALLAVKRSDVETRLAELRTIGLPRVDILQADLGSLANFMAAERLAEDYAASHGGSSANNAVALVDFGADATHVVCAGSSHTWFRTAVRAGDDATRAIVQHKGMTYRQAEDAKRRPEETARLSEFCDVSAPVIEGLYDEVVRCLDSFQQDSAASPLSRVFICGGNAQLLGLIPRLRGAAAPDR